MDAASPVFALLSVACIVCWRLEHARRVRADGTAVSLREARQAATRLIRLTAGDQRTMALTLFGHAQSGRPDCPAISALGRRLLDMSEDLCSQTEAPDEPRFIAEEVLWLLPVVEFAMAQVAAQLGPSRRAWRVDPGFEAARLVADRRAVNQVLVHVLSGAASTTRDGDWIELSLEEDAEGFAIVVQDEGVGLPVAQLGEHREDSRGIGLRLTLARSLMQAHGGTLAVASAERVGTRVRLVFPKSRMAAAA